MPAILDALRRASKELQDKKIVEREVKDKNWDAKDRSLGGTTETEKDLPMALNASHRNEPATALGVSHRSVTLLEDDPRQENGFQASVMNSSVRKNIAVGVRNLAGTTVHNRPFKLTGTTTGDGGYHNPIGLRMTSNSSSIKQANSTRSGQKGHFFSDGKRSFFSDRTGRQMKADSEDYNPRMHINGGGMSTQKRSNLGYNSELVHTLSSEGPLSHYQNEGLESNYRGVRIFGNTIFQDSLYSSTNESLDEAIRLGQVNTKSTERPFAANNPTRLDRRIMKNAREFGDSATLLKHKLRQRRDVKKSGSRRSASYGSTSNGVPYVHNQPIGFGEPSLEECVELLEKLQASNITIQQRDERISPRRVSPGKNPHSISGKQCLTDGGRKNKHSRSSVLHPNIDNLILSILADRPEWRAHMAVLTTCPILRQRILEIQAPGGRADGSSVLGSTFPWRGSNIPVNAVGSDHNWPRVDPIRGHLARPSVLPSPIENIKQNPTIDASKRYSFSKAERFPELEKTDTPGPGYYGNWLNPKGVAFTTTAGDVVLGPNHTFPFKRLLGENIETKFDSCPIFSFPKTRRAINEVKRGNFSTTAVKTDQGCLSPGPVYQHFSIFYPSDKVGRPGRARSEKLLRERLH